MKQKKNSYLEEVVAGSQLIQANLSQSLGDQIPLTRENSSTPRSTASVQVKVKGWGFWQRVLVPPNAFVIHTREGEKEPLHCGMGLSFRFNPYRDTFLVAPAAMQTIIVNASCISAERQGVMVQAYVQWMIEDFSKAYQRLDLSDQRDPMRVTNLQLQQQAEATIKDTVATMNIDEILADKQPIIEVLTARLRTVAEGTEQGAGLGLRIVTVQIKEAVVSSASLWETLQKAFRAERSKEARLAELRADLTIQEEESRAALRREEVELDRKDKVERLKLEREAAHFQLTQEEQARRARLEAEHAVERAQHEAEIVTQSAKLKRLNIEQEHALEELQLLRELDEAGRRLELRRRQLEVEPEFSAAQLQQLLIEQLPTIAEKLPKPESLKVYSGSEGEGGQLSRFVNELSELLSRWPKGPH
ncbi:MAG: SPFH domain-containing protein [Myxococcota bacterium]|nr:SPFH domain-containing protein [Myxococcota bacterium]